MANKEEKFDERKHFDKYYYNKNMSARKFRKRMGCDYCKKIKGIGPMNAYKLIKQYKSLEIFFGSAPEAGAEKTRLRKLGLRNLNSFINARNMFLNPNINYEIENDFKLTKIDIDNFNNRCETLGIANNYKNKILKIRQCSNYNPITNYI